MPCHAHELVISVTLTILPLKFPLLHLFQHTLDQLHLRFQQVWGLLLVQPGLLQLVQNLRITVIASHSQEHRNQLNSIHQQSLATLPHIQGYHQVYRLVII